jgi:hypothetical protein
MSDVHTESLRSASPPGIHSPWRKSATCVDYRVYVCDLPDLDSLQWQSAVERMRILGQCHDNPCGVTTVRGSWGFFQIPPAGFPELKVTFFRFTRSNRRRSLLRALAAALWGSGGEHDT